MEKKTGGMGRWRKVETERNLKKKRQKKYSVFLKIWLTGVEPRREEKESWIFGLWFGWR